MKNPGILIIDDDLDLLLILERVLSEEGYRVTAVSNGFEGIRRHSETRPRLILLDLNMPEIGGMDILRKIRENDKDVAVIIVTAFGNSRNFKEASDLGVYGFLEKPFQLDAVKKMVNEALAAKE